MTAHRWRQVKELLDRALDLDREARRDLLDDLHSDDPEVAAEVELLLALETEAGDFIEEPVFDIHDQDDPSVRVGQRVGRYRLVKEIGHGGMGAVYLAARADQEYDQSVAVKVLKRGLDTEEIVYRFRNERQILAGLDHPNVARLLDGGTTPDGRPFLVMDHVEGRPIDVYCHQEGLGIDARLDLFLTVCSAVQFAHRNLVVHRDLKPSNILVSDDGVPKLLDFGIARLLTPERAYTLPTASAWRFLTPEYASPEQLSGAPITTATDVYSLGVLLYALLTDRRPYDGEDRSATALARVLEHAEPPKPSAVAPPERTRRLRGDLDNIVLTALRREPERRYGSVETLADDLRRHREGLPVRATPDSLRYRVGKFVRRHKAGVATAALIALLLVAFGVVTSVLLDRAVKAREVAVEAQEQAEREEALAQSVSDLLVDLFKAPDPTQGYDKDVTARQILDEGRRRFLESGELDDQPELKAELLYRLAATYLALGLDEEAQELTSESKRTWLDVAGPDTDELVDVLVLEAEIAREAGEGERVEPLLREAIRIRRLRHGPKDPIIWVLYNNLASAFSDRGELDEAERINRESLDQRRELFGQRSPEVATALNNWADNLKELGRWEDSERRYHQALEIRRAHEDASKRDIASTLNGLASLLETTGRLEEAEGRYREALRLSIEHFEEPTRQAAFIQSNLAGLLTKQGRIGEAEEFYAQALEILGTEHRSRGRILTRMAVLRLRRGEPEGAEEAAREALSSLDPEIVRPWWVADARSVLGAALADQGRFAEAEPLLLDAYREIAEATGPDPDTVAAARERIFDLYEAWGRPEEAGAWRSREIESTDL